MQELNILILLNSLKNLNIKKNRLSLILAYYQLGSTHRKKIIINGKATKRCWSS